MISLTNIVGIIVILLVLGLIGWVVGKAPFIEQPFKTFINYVLIVIGAVVVIYFLLGLVGLSHGILIN